MLSKRLSLRTRVLRLTVLLATLCSTGELCADIPYRVEFSGTLDPETLALLKNHSQLISLCEKQPETLSSLQRRARADIPNLIQALHSLALFNADIELNVDTATSPVTVRIHVEPGPVFRLKSFRILPAAALLTAQSQSPEEILERGHLFLQQNFLLERGDSAYPGLDDSEGDDEVQWVDDAETVAQNCLELSAITEEFLGLQLGAAALPCTILEAEEDCLKWINNQGYPLAEVVKREVIADQTEHTVVVNLYVETGLLAFLAEPNITGYRHVERCYIESKVGWCEGDLYTPETIACTFDKLERTGLFRSINVELGAELDDEGLLPVDIIVAEGRHRTVGFGGSYSTEFGGGVIAEWAHRNIRGMGDRLSFQTELLQRFQSGEITYLQPDYLCEGTDWLLGVEGEREITDGFHERSVTATSRLHRRLTPRLQGWIGVAVMYTHSTDSDNDKYFLLGKIPMQLRYNSADNLLDPSYGTAMNLKFTPTMPLWYPSGNYYSLRFDGTAYIPMTACKNWIMAGKVSLGTIMGASRKDIPPPERCYAGSPNTLRGYAYLSVSPLSDKTGKPEGGRSLMVMSLESRYRLNETWGLVGFWEIGNVYEGSVPQFNHKQLQSVGVGGRYYTPVGPLRLDIAYPIDRRRGIDSAVQVYFSIGQTF